MKLYSFKKISSLSKKDLFSHYKTSLNGLSQKNVISRRKLYGINQIQSAQITPFQIYIRQFKSVFIYLLFMAIGFSTLVGEYIDASLILLFILINTTLGFVQEFRANKASEILKSYITLKTHILRNGRPKLINVENVVVGDIVVLQAGDKIPADVRLFQVAGLLVDESILTGESLPVLKQEQALAKKPQEYFEAKNIGFSGTLVLEGEARGLVFATGNNTAFGAIAHLATATEHVSDFQKGIDSFSSFILKLISCTIIGILVLNISIKGFASDTLIDLILFSIALAISVIPETLPLITTLSLSIGASHLAKEKVIVKRLSAIEDLGGLEVLCTDKTGTITNNVLEVVGIQPYQKADKKTVIWYGLLASSFLGEQVRQANNAFDVALQKYVSESIKETAKQYLKKGEIPFNPSRRRNAVLVQDPQGLNHLIVRGALEEILPLCTNIIQKKNLLSYVRQEGLKGRRVIAVAYRSYNGSILFKEVQEAELTLIGLISFEDTLKSGTKVAVARAKDLHIQVKILTGDAPEVAGAVGFSIGLNDHPDQVITGKDFSAMSLDKKEEAVRQYNVFARVNPEQKFEIIQVLQKDYVTGFLGEGFNDAPALKLASVSMVVENASDIAKESADIILLNKDLGVIIHGVTQGRIIFTNIVKYIRLTLASNFGNFYSVAIVSLFINFLPMLPIQILLVNLLSDFPMSAIATDTVDAEELTRPQQNQIHQVIYFATLMAIVSSIFDFIVFATFFRDGPARLQTMWFIASILTELALIFSLRTKNLFWKSTRPSALLMTLCGSATLATILVPFSQFGHDIFSFITPRGQDIVVVLGIVVVYFIASEITKVLYYKVAKRTG